MYSVSAEQKRNYFIYLLLMFLLTTAIVWWLLMGDYFNLNVTKTKEKYSGQINKDLEFRKDQQQMLPAIDSLFTRIATYNPAVNALYAENEISEQVRQLKKMSEKSVDPRYKSFNHLGEIYAEYFNSKKELGNIQKGINDINKSLQRSGGR
jgi:hypothetical protein